MKAVCYFYAEAHAKTAGSSSQFKRTQNCGLTQFTTNTKRRQCTRIYNPNGGWDKGRREGKLLCSLVTSEIRESAALEPASKGILRTPQQGMTCGCAGQPVRPVS